MTANVLARVLAARGRIRAGLARRLRPRDEPVPGRQWVVADHKAWGDNIVHEGADGDLRRWHGHTTPRPELHDELVVRMRSQGSRREYTAAFMITGIQYCADPPDMWFATTSRGRTLPD